MLLSAQREPFRYPQSLYTDASQANNSLFFLTTRARQLFVFNAVTFTHRKVSAHIDARAQFLRIPNTQQYWFGGADGFITLYESGRSNHVSRIPIAGVIFSFSYFPHYQVLVVITTSPNAVSFIDITRRRYLTTLSLPEAPRSVFQLTRNIPHALFVVTEKSTVFSLDIVQRKIHAFEERREATNIPTPVFYFLKSSDTSELAGIDIHKNMLVQSIPLSFRARSLRYHANRLVFITANTGDLYTYEPALQKFSGPFSTGVQNLRFWPTQQMSHTPLYVLSFPKATKVFSLNFTEEKPLRLIEPPTQTCIDFIALETSSGRRYVFADDVNGGIHVTYPDGRILARISSTGAVLWYD